ncbi:cell wall / vacuolar inhibitor of fructosidase 2-like [Euphorbia lathyris]|uniref:cell wall / vacuolar inhibitor of fructosidase 2-like n=1 Tax=Euphorbia lathyris TaxID=212925 RepID=UPI0033132AD7
MSCSSKIFYSVLLTLSFLAFSGTSIRTQDLISTTCSHTLYYQICVSSLTSDSHSKTADLQGLANIALNVSTLYGEETFAHITDLESKANETLNSGSGCLSVCIEVYRDANDNLKQTVEALRDKSEDDLKTFVTSAMTDSDTCEQCFLDMQQDSPVSDRNLYFSKLCSNFLAIASLLNP